MALINPFINSINAFDATIGTTIYMGVLGGDAITKYKFRLYNNDGSISPFYNSEWIEVQNDVSSQSIRSFPILLNSAFGLKNNSSYKIEPITANDEQPNGVVGQQSLFQCYATPDLTLKYKTIVDGTSSYEPVTSETVFSSSEVQFRLEVSKDNINSLMRPNNIIVSLYGIDHSGHKNIVSGPKTIYKFNRNIDEGVYYLDFSLKGFMVNVDEYGYGLSPQDSLFKSFEIGIEFYTVEGMNVSYTLKDLYCYYITIDNPSVFDVFNICDRGVVKLEYSLTSFMGTSNPSPPIFLNEEEVDLSESSSWALWQKYFTLTQPFTLRIWGRKFLEGSIFLATETKNSNNYIDIRYNSEMEDGEEYVFISIQSGQTTSDGTPLFPYYLESNRILKSSISETTNIFVGVQKQNNLFELDFRTI